MQTFLRLKSQRQLLLIGLAVLAAISLALAYTLIHDRTTPDTIRLGTGVASVESKPVSAFDRSASSPKNQYDASSDETSLGSGEASFYGDELAGNRTASGEVFDPRQYTAAHRTLPLGSRVRVTNTRNGESVVVRINDRGPYHGGRVIDLSTAAARTIGLIQSGTGRVRLGLLAS